MSGEERERGATSNASPSWGRGALRDDTKTPAWETSSSAVGEVYITSLYKENKQFLGIRCICGEGKGGEERIEKRRYQNFLFLFLFSLSLP